MSAIIKAEHLSFAYQGDEDTPAVQALKDVSFEIEEVNAGSDDLLDLISEVRFELRANKQYDLSDKIRDNLQALGYEIND